MASIINIYGIGRVFHNLPIQFYPLIQKLEERLQIYGYMVVWGHIIKRYSRNFSHCLQHYPNLVSTIKNNKYGVSIGYKYREFLAGCFSGLLCLEVEGVEKWDRLVHVAYICFGIYVVQYLSWQQNVHGNQNKVVVLQEGGDPCGLICHSDLGTVKMCTTKNNNS